MTLLDSVWLLSFLMAMASLSVLIGLIALRLIKESALHRREELKKMWSRKLHIMLNASVNLEGENLPAIKTCDKEVICDIAFDMLRIVRGKDVERLVANLKGWKLDAWLSQAALRGSRGKRIRALALLAQFKSQDILEILLVAARDKDSYVQMAALRGIANRRDPSLLRKMVQALMEAPHQTNTLMLADVLKTFRESGVAELERLTDSAMRREIRLAAIKALGMIGAGKSVETLLELTEQPDQDIRAQSLMALGRTGDQRAQEAIFAGLESESYPVRLSAAQAAGNLGLHHAVPKLANLLNDPVWWVRYRAASALYQLGTAGQDMLTSISIQQNVAGEMARQILAERRGVAA
ncbi:MAG: HEAT repeat domain-containing protein [Bdellovibrionales bacterium]